MMAVAIEWTVPAITVGRDAINDDILRGSGGDDGLALTAASWLRLIP
jgi:hypothetical protein